MDKNRLWIIGSVLVMVIVVALGWVLGVQPQFALAAAAAEQLAAARQTNATHEASLAKLKDDFKGIDALNQQLASLSQSVPSGTNVPAYVDQLDALATANQVTIKTLTVADPEAYTPVAPVAPVVPAASSDTSVAPAPTPTEAPAPVAVPGSPPVTNAKITAENFASLPVAITVSGSYGNVLNFVNGLQTGSRLFLVTGLSTTAAQKATAPAAGESTGSKTASAASGGAPTVDGMISGLIFSIFTAATPAVIGAG